MYIISISFMVGGLGGETEREKKKIERETRAINSLNYLFIELFSNYSENTYSISVPFYIVRFLFLILRICSFVLRIFLREFLLVQELLLRFRLAVDASDDVSTVSSEDSKSL